MQVLKRHLSVTPVANQFRTCYRFPTMLAKYEALCKFVMMERKMCGDDVSKGTSHQQHLHMIDCIKKERSLDLPDVNAILERLQDDTPAFSAEQRRAIACAVSTVAKSDSPSTSHVNGDLRQTHMYAYNYLPQSVWTTLLDASISFEDKMASMTTFLVSIGCINPSEPTRASLVAIICIASQNKLMPEQQYSRVHEFGEMFATKRGLGGCVQTMKTFPQSVTSFIALHNTLYTPDQPPTASPINITHVRELQAVIPTRSTNKRLQSKTRNSAQYETPQPRGMDPDSMRMMWYMMNGGPGVSPSQPRSSGDVGDPRLTIFRRNNKHLALPDGPRPACRDPADDVIDPGPSSDKSIVPHTHDSALPGCLHDTPATHHRSMVVPDAVGADPSLAAMEIKVAAALAKAKALRCLTPPASKKAKKTKSLAVKTAMPKTTESSEDSESDGGDDDEDAKPMSMKAMKAAKAAPMKSIADHKSMKATPPAKAMSGKKLDKVVHTMADPKVVSLTPTEHNGGKIYFAKSKSMYGTFRVYKRKCDKVETSISITDKTTKAKQRAWAACLRCIDEDSRPRS